MSKPYKIKRYGSRIGRRSQKAPPHPFAIAGGIVAALALFFLGMSIYRPVYNLIMGEYSQSSAPTPAPEESLPEEQPAEEEPKPEEVVAAPSEMKAVYLPHTVAANPEQLSAFWESVENKGISAVMIDLKNAEGTLLYRSQTPQAQQWNHVAENALDLAAFVQQAKEKEMRVIGRMFAFQDVTAPRLDRSYAVNYQDSQWLWLDAAPEAGGKPWMNPYSPQAQEYLAAVALEAVQMGVAHIVMDGVRFPSFSDGGNANFGAGASGVSRAQALQAFVSTTKAKLVENAGDLSVYLPASAFSSVEQQTIYGGNPGSLAENILLGELSTDTAVVQQAADLVAANMASARVWPLLSGAGDEQALKDRIGLWKSEDNSDFVLFVENGIYSLPNLS